MENTNTPCIPISPGQPCPEVAQAHRDRSDRARRDPRARDRHPRPPLRGRAEPDQEPGGACYDDRPQKACGRARPGFRERGHPVSAGYSRSWTSLPIGSSLTTSMRFSREAVGRTHLKPGRRRRSAVKQSESIVRAGGRCRGNAEVPVPGQLGGRGRRLSSRTTQASEI